MTVAATIQRLMRLRRKAQVPKTQLPSRRDAWIPIHEPFAGAFQRHIKASSEDVLSLPTTFNATGLIAQDAAKLKIIMARHNASSGVNERVSLSWVDDLIARPNPFQNRLQFVESWIISKLLTGNACVLKSRNEIGRVAALYVLDWRRVKPLFTPAGSVLYALGADNLSNVIGDIVLPQSEIIHDRFNTFYHPLVGLSPLHPAARAAAQGIQIQQQAANFWANNAQPGGALVVPTEIDESEARRLKAMFTDNFSGDNRGRLAVLAGGMDYKPFSPTARDSQMVEQLRLTREEIAIAFRLPLYKVGAAPPPAVANTGQLDQEYYSNCLQPLLEMFEECLTLGLELPLGHTLAFDTKNLLRMDPLTNSEVLRNKVEGGIMTRNEARREDDLPPLPGGDVLLVQEQYWSASAVADPSRGVPKKAAAADSAAKSFDASEDLLVDLYKQLLAA